MLGRMEVTAQRIEAREASSRVDQTATYSLTPSSNDSAMGHEDGEARRTPVVLSISHLIVFSVVCRLVFLTEDASSEPAIKVNARDVIEEEGNSDRRGESTGRKEPPERRAMAACQASALSHHFP